MYGSLNSAVFRTLRSGHSKALGQNNKTKTIAHTIPQPIQVMFGCSACHARIFLWNLTSG
jgi:hypothetical protein